MLYLIGSPDTAALCVHMMYSMCMHSCLNTCLRENMCLNCLSAQVCGHACMHMCGCTCVCQWLLCTSQPTQTSISFCVGKWAYATDHVCSCVLLCVCEQFSGLQASAPYLVLAAGGVQQVPNCCRPHNGFYKPVAGTGLWLSCQLGSPPLYPCRLHWRSSQSMK